jgi:hypothetical protein
VPVPAPRRALASALVERDQLTGDVEALCMSQAASAGGDPRKKGPASKVWRCRLTVSKPELKARLVSALETEM